MKPEAQNKAIAESLGYSQFTGRGAMWCKKNHRYIVMPNYTGDLNAMHEAEKIGITSDNSEDYDRYLREAMQDAHDYIWHSTAAQRAEAFLRTLGKWEESA